MLQSITWSDYFTAAALLAGAWYVIITLIYFRKEALTLLSGKYKIPIKKKAKVTAAEAEDAPEEEHSFEQLEGIVTDIRHSILEVAGKGANKEMLLTQLTERLANYGGLRLPAFRIAINNFIIQHAQSICGVAFSEEELDGAWEALPR
jgi:hypothetical protein